MDFVSIEPPSTRSTAAGKSLEFCDALLRIIPAGQLLQVVAYQLIQALAKGVSLSASSLDQLIVNR
jgi:hypothetical protein